VVADGMTGARHDSNQELIGQGAANMLTPLFGGFAATGAIARTATNIRNGATSPLSGVVHALFLVAVMLVLAPWACCCAACTRNCVALSMPPASRRWSAMPISAQTCGRWPRG
jgi:SulP family sulfate permease